LFGKGNIPKLYPEVLVLKKIAFGRSSGFLPFQVFPSFILTVTKFEKVYSRFTATGIAPELHRIPILILAFF